MATSESIILATIAEDRAGRVDYSKQFDSDELNKRVLITGGASGLGEGTARMFAAGGAYVVIADKSITLGQALEQDLLALGAKVKFIEVDVSSWTSQVAMFAEALKFFPEMELDVLIACAGVAGDIWKLVPEGPESLLESTPIPPSTSSTSIGLIGSWYSVNLAARYGMGLHKKEKSTLKPSSLSKSIILISSTAGYRSLSILPDYTASKWGVRGLFRNLRTELPALGVRINLLVPYFIPTRMTAPMVPVLQKQGVEMGKVETFVEGVARLTADDTVNGKRLA
jgi:5'-hydroxyaverantin dehydrogenase